jgi:ABC-type cobalamin/Fe3+-siderophores transport system ATPase subunit
MARIVLDGVTEMFGSEVVAVNDMSLDIRDGEFMVLVGPSGCGKSTILRLLAGLEDVTADEIFIGDREVTDLPPKEREGVPGRTADDGRTARRTVAPLMLRAGRRNLHRSANSVVFGGKDTSPVPTVLEGAQLHWSPRLASGRLGR